MVQINKKAEKEYELALVSLRKDPFDVGAIDKALDSAEELKKDKGFFNSEIRESVNEGLNDYKRFLTASDISHAEKLRLEALIANFHSILFGNSSVARFQDRIKKNDKDIKQLIVLVEKKRKR